MPQKLLIYLLCLNLILSQTAIAAIPVFQQSKPYYSVNFKASTLNAGNDVLINVSKTDANADTQAQADTHTTLALNTHANDVHIIGIFIIHLWIRFKARLEN